MKTKIAIFASGNGTNFTALAHAIQAKKLPVEISLLVCDVAKAPVIAKAQALGIETVVINFHDYPNKAAAEQVLLQRLTTAQVSWLFLAGYMRIIGKTLLGAYPAHIVNIHPALLPKFPGRHGIEDAYAAGVTTTGVTIHFVDAGVDTGQIIAQRSVRRQPNDSLAELATKIHAVEHQLYPLVLEQLLVKEQTND